MSGCVSDAGFFEAHGVNCLSAFRAKFELSLDIPLTAADLKVPGTCRR